MNNLPQSLQSLWHSSLRLPLLLLLALVFLAGYFSGGDGTTPAAISAAGTAATWTCSMHPQIQQPGPGQCPICGMDLIPVSNHGDTHLGPRELHLSPAARQLAAIRTTTATRRAVETGIRMSGKIEIDETRLGTIAAYVPGRIERLFVNYTGTRVRKGDHLATIYSPELLSAQSELLQALQRFNTLSTTPGRQREGALANLQAVRERLRLWGFGSRQIEQIEQRGTTSEQMTIYSPLSGVVMQRNAAEGMYVQTGSIIYKIADLSKLWVKLDAYESDLEWLRYGQQVEFRTVAYPGEVFNGRIAFIDPVLDPRTRTVKVRVNVDNSDARLKPDMLVRAIAQAQVAASGRVIDPALRGKWISPMHPEVVKDRPGNCDVCGMALVRAEELGYSSAEADRVTPLVIPATAPLITGKRALVYVADPQRPGVFTGREIELGPRSGDWYIVYSGLHEGEEVVSYGAFKLDSDLQIRARPSMMNPAAPTGAEEHQHDTAADIPAELRQSVQTLLNSYFALQQALAADNLPAARIAGSAINAALPAGDNKGLSRELTGHLKTLRQALQEEAAVVSASADIAQARQAFEPLSQQMLLLAKSFGPLPRSIFRFHCPMAFNNRGADWLQDHNKLQNPYFGAGMLGCGTQEEVIPGSEEHK